MGVPVEIRVTIYTCVLEHSDKKVIVPCCPSHAETMRSEKSLVWRWDKKVRLKSYVRDFAALNGVNKTISAELQSFCLQNWQVVFCIDHCDTNDEAFKSPLEDHRTHSSACLLRSTGTLPLKMRGMPTEMCSLMTFINDIVLRVDFVSVINPDKWDTEELHWEITDSLRNMINLVGAREQTCKLTVLFEMLDDSADELEDCGKELRDCLATLEQLSDEINLKVGVSCSEIKASRRHAPGNKSLHELLDLEDDYLSKLRGSKRRKHFPLYKKSLTKEFWKLQAFTKFAFARVWPRDGDDGVGSRFELVDDEEDDEIKEIISLAWEASHTGNKTDFKDAEKALMRKWRDHNKFCKLVLTMG